jgi:uncharacterized protein (DUF58 family)
VSLPRARSQGGQVALFALLLLLAVGMLGAAVARWTVASDARALRDLELAQTAAGAEAGAEVLLGRTPPASTRLTYGYPTGRVDVVASEPPASGRPPATTATSCATFTPPAGPPSASVRVAQQVALVGGTWIVLSRSQGEVASCP